MITLLILVPLIGSLLVMAIPSNRWRPMGIPIVALIHFMLMCVVVAKGEQWALGRWLAIDPLSRIFVWFVSLLFLICAIYAPAYLRLRANRDNRIFCACLLAALSMMSLVALAHHLGLMWIAMEATTLATAPCVYFNRNARSLEATWKYLVIGSVGIALALLGSFFLAYSMIQAGSESTLLFDELVEHSHRLSLPWLHAAFVLLLVGYGTKMGLAPMHTWKPDAYGEAPGLVGALLAGGLTSCAFLCVLRFYHIAHIAHDDQYTHQLMRFMGLLSMGTAAVFMARQRDLKRMLAYSSIEHMGMLAFGMGVGGLAAGGALLHVIHNGLCKAGLFMAAGNIHRIYGSKSTDKIRGLFKLAPWSGGALILLFFAITGSPPLAPFVSEFQILAGAFAAHHWYAGVLFLVFILLVFFGMGRTLLESSLGPVPADQPKPKIKENIFVVTPVLFVVIGMIWLGVSTPQFLASWISQAVEFLDRMPVD